VNRDGVVNTTDVQIVMGDYASGKRTVLLSGYVGGAGDSPATQSVSLVTSWNQIYPEEPLTGGSSCSCGGGGGNGSGGTGCDAQIINCPGTARVGEEVVISGGGGLGETCTWSVGGDAPILIEENGGVFRFRGLGPGTVTVHLVCQNGACCSCADCTIVITDGGQPPGCHTRVRIVRWPTGNFMAWGGTYQFEALGYPPGGTYEWSYEDLGHTVAQFSPDGRIATVHVGPQQGFIGSVVVFVRYVTPDGCRDFDQRAVRVLGDCDGDGLPDDTDPYPCDVDGDGDGVPDAWEIIMGTNPRDDKDYPDMTLDSDGDGLSDVEEICLYHTDPYRYDTDNDGASDGAEVELGLNPLNPRSSGEVGADGTVVLDGRSTVYLAHDQDGDYAYDEQERMLGLNPRNADMDGDGVPDGWELRLGSDPCDSRSVPDVATQDSDHDGLSDFDEMRQRTDPNNWDTDGDGIPDGWEVHHGLDPLNPADGGLDPDGDGLSNLQEFFYGSDPHNHDSDGDGVDDGAEVNQGSDPMDGSDGGQPPDPATVVRVRLLVEGGGAWLPVPQPESPVTRFVLSFGPHTLVSGGSYAGALQFCDVTLPLDRVYEANIRPAGSSGDTLCTHYAHRPDYMNYWASWEPIDWSIPWLWGDPDGVFLPDRWYWDYPLYGCTTAPPMDPYDSDCGRCNPGGALPMPVVYTHHPGRYFTDLHIDADNNNGLELPDGLKPERDAKDVDGLPGKIVAVNNDDADGDGIPDSIDGLSLPGVPESDDAGPIKLVPLTLTISMRFVDPPDRAGLRVAFDYPASHPGLTGGNEETGYTYGPGSLRLWLTDPATGRAGRGRTDAMHGGFFIDSGGNSESPWPAYTLAELGLPPEGGTVTLWLESLTPSTTLGDQHISVGLAGWHMPDTVRVTSFTTRFLQHGVNPEWTEVRTLPASRPSPTVTMTQGMITNPRVDPTDPHRILVDIALGGLVADRASDLVPGPDGTISCLSLQLNGHDAEVNSSGGNPDSIGQITPYQIDKATPAGDLTRPFAFSAQYATVLYGVRVEAGSNKIQLGAENLYGFAGSAQASFEVVPIAPPGWDPEAAEDWTGYSFQVPEQNLLTTLVQTGGGNITPLFAELVGPPQLASVFDRLRVGDPASSPEYGLIRFEDHTLLAGMELGVNARYPKALLAVGHSTVIPGAAPGEDPAEPRYGAWNYAKGYGAGLYDTGVGVVDGVHGLGKGVWYAVRNYNEFSIVCRIAGGGGLLTVEDRRRLSIAWNTAQALSNVYLQVLNVQTQVIEDVLTGNQDDLRQLGEDYAFVGECAVEIIEAIAAQIDSLDDFQKGRIVGRITGEVLLLVATDGLAQATKAGVLGETVQRLRQVSFLPEAVRAPVLERLTAIEQFAARLATTRMCFVAGTPVWTAEGPRPIETIRVGDRVLSRDPGSGEQGFRPVLGTVTTHPSVLYHVRVSDAGGREEEIVGTAQHPFFVQERCGFVPAAELAAGNTLVLASGLPASVVEVGHVAAAAGASFTTYNFEVEEFHTYFVGDDGVWVHNAGPACQRVAAFIERLMTREGLSRWSAFQQFMRRTNTIARRRTVDSVLVEMTNENFLKMYQEAALLGDDGVGRVPTVQGIRDLKAEMTAQGLSTRFGPAEIENHHSTPQYLLRMLIEHAHPGWADSELAAEFARLEPQMPGYLVHQVEHTGTPEQGLGSFHSILSRSESNGGVGLRRLEPGEPIYERSTIINGLERAYNDWGRPEVWQVSRRWLIQNGVIPGP
jgi:hypothetical protein